MKRVRSACVSQTLCSVIYSTSTVNATRSLVSLELGPHVRLINTRWLMSSNHVSHIHCQSKFPGTHFRQSQTGCQGDWFNDHHPYEDSNTRPQRHTQACKPSSYWGTEADKLCIVKLGVKYVCTI